MRNTTTWLIVKIILSGSILYGLLGILDGMSLVPGFDSFWSKSIVFITSPLIFLITTKVLLGNTPDAITLNKGRSVIIAAILFFFMSVGLFSFSAPQILVSPIVSISIGALLYVAIVMFFYSRVTKV